MPWKKEFLSNCRSAIHVSYVAVRQWLEIPTNGLLIKNVLAVGGWSWMVVDIFWLVVGGDGWWWVVAWFSLTRCIIYCKSKRKIKLHQPFFENLLSWKKFLPTKKLVKNCFRYHKIFLTTISDVCRYEEMVQYPKRNLPTKYLTASCHLPSNNIVFLMVFHSDFIVDTGLR